MCESIRGKRLLAEFIIIIRQFMQIRACNFKMKYKSWSAENIYYYASLSDLSVMVKSIQKTHFPHAKNTSMPGSSFSAVKCLWSQINCCISTVTMRGKIAKIYSLQFL